MSQAKGKLREKYKAIRLGMSPAEVQANSQIICKKLIAAADWRSIGSFSAFRPIPKLNEINIKPFLTDIKVRYPAVKIVQLSQSKNQELPDQKFDAVIVPCLAFDKSNHRLGWGGGFYDRFLADQPQALKIGVCFQNGFVKGGLPREDHDIRLDKIITEV